jgi:GTP-binding protein
VRFIDEVVLEVVAGDGGNGCAAFRRESHVPRGGPAGGDGGAGGDVVLRADEGLGTLFDLHLRRKVAAERGEDGRGKDQYGAAGESVVVRVPVGTEVFDDETGERIGDLTVHGATCVAAKGGRGGWGNIRFATPSDRGPRRADPGTPGERRRVRLSLKLLADAGIVGMPNAGKSTLISRASGARPKIADYPFTTLVPNLGVVSVGVDASFVLADVPGLIPGASRGAGLGIQFLKHLSRTRVLLFLLAPDPDPARSPRSDYDALDAELRAFDAELALRPRVVAWNKMDLPDARGALDDVRRSIESADTPFFAISAVTGEGVEALLAALYESVRQARAHHEG